MALVLAVVMIGSLLECAALAESYRYVTAQSGKALAIDPTIVYKVNVKKDSIVTIEYYNNQAGNEVWARLYSKKVLEDDHCVIWGFTHVDLEKAQISRILKKGVYYLHADEEVKKPAKLRVTVTPIVDEKNYSPARAKLVKAKQVVKVGFTPATFFTRWYKLKLNKAKKLRLYCSKADGALDPSNFNHVLDSRLRWIQLYENENSKKPCFVSNEKLPAGTYYICVYQGWTEYDYDVDMWKPSYDTSCCSFYWE